jgi:nucleoside-diphosphate-sugar epimerase
MNLLVTGGAGFIGSNFVRYWLERYPEDRVLNLDLLTYAGNLASLEDVVARFGERYLIRPPRAGVGAGVRLRGRHAGDRRLVRRERRMVAAVEGAAGGTGSGVRELR